MKSSLSRRDFLKVAGVTSVGTAAMLTLASCGKKEDTSSNANGGSTETKEDKGQDLVQQSNQNLVQTEKPEETAETKSNYIRPTLVVGGSDPGSIPPYSPNMDGRIVLWEMYELLFEQAAFGANMSPVLCDPSKGKLGGYDHEDGSTKYTFYIYDYIKDAKGYPVTADDVVYCFENYFAQGGKIKKWVGIKALDSTTIELEFTQELQEVGEIDGDMNSVFIFSQKAFEESGDQFTMTACGTGRYELVDFVAGNSITLKRRDDYWQTNEDLIPLNQQANVGELRIDFISEVAQKVIALQTGSVDMIEALPTEYVSQFANDDRYQLFSYKDNLTWYLLFNCSSDSKCSDLNLRLAIANAVDIEGILAALGEGFGARAYIVGNDNFGDYNPDWETQDNYNTKSGAGDPAQIKSWLDAAGYKGEEIVLLAPTGSENEKICTVVQAQCLNYGITIKILQLDSAAASTTTEDSTAWDIRCDRAASKGFICSIWGGSMLNKEMSTKGHTTGFIEDDVLEEMTHQVLLVSGHTTENMNALHDHIIENCYVMGLLSQYSNMILPADLKTLVRNGKKWMIHTACEYNDPNA